MAPSWKNWCISALTKVPSVYSDLHFVQSHFNASFSSFTRLLGLHFARVNLDPEQIPLKVEWIPPSSGPLLHAFLGLHSVRINLDPEQFPGPEPRT
jgi:hypothetical protein